MPPPGRKPPPELPSRFRFSSPGCSTGDASLINRTFWASAAVLCAAAAWTTAVPGAQAKRKADWLTDGGDAQRTSWQRNETILTKDSVKGVQLLWKIETDNQSRQMHNLFPPLIAGNVSTPSGDKEIAILAGVSDNVYGIDVATGRQIWKRKFDSTYQEATG